MSARMTLPIVLTNKESNETELVDAFSLAVRGQGGNAGTKLKIWEGNCATERSYKETPDQIADKIYKAYKKAGITVCPR